MKTRLPPDGHGCLTDLELGELVSGHLDDKARQRAQSHLVECEVCYELFEEAHLLLAPEDSVELHGGNRKERLVEPTRPQGEKSDATPLPGRSRIGAWAVWGTAASVAAGLALAVLLPSSPSQTGTVSWPAFQAATPTLSQSSPLPALPRAQVDRGVASSRRTAGDFRLGATWVQVEAATRLGLIEQVEQDAAEMKSLILERAEEGEISPLLASELRALLSTDEDPAKAINPEEMGALTPQLTEEMRQHGYEFDLGRFASAGLLAAATGNTDWFGQGASPEQYLQAMLALDAESLSGTARRGLQAVDRAWPRQQAEAELAAVRDALGELVREYDRP